ncbi:uncharacterized protein N7511_005087 [Penicillium nucicola]|uniref:uncharacterized protein n=1 Tax=Penicillium nucicola TaxID=1850975 RepID=UPI002545962D|nr:uncharacterized protein N7511_005087 [Penicillium nucicola]KAJ5761705.1 hypothetical protein N7511_005087 [Penicillium nucicola]
MGSVSWSFLVVKVVAFGAPITAGRASGFPGPPNLYVGPRWLPRRGAEFCLRPRHCWSLWTLVADHT